MDRGTQGSGSILKTALGTLLKVVLTVIGYTALGLALNVALLVSRWDQLAALFAGSADLSVIAQAMTGLLLLGVCALPIVFFLVGKRQAIQGATSRMISAKKYDMILFFLKQLSARQPDMLAKDPMISPSLSAMTAYIAQAYQSLPWVMSLLLSHFAARADLAGRLISAIDANKIALNGQSVPEKQAALASIISEMIPDDLMAPDLTVPLMVLALNVGLFFI